MRALLTILADLRDGAAAVAIVLAVLFVCFARGVHAAPLSPDAGSPHGDLAILGALVLIVGSAIKLLFPRRSK